ncbi:MAG: arsenite efflux transporter metallochaperone ArsD [Acidimicrobiaceae bacterium]|nr:arsenite efflux transporter metallochaperone ArsD [Acidimicrobiaceae bacterium]
MCCSTGVCGPSVDPALAHFAADLDNLAASGATVRRYNLGQEPLAFAQNDQVREILTAKGVSGLPVVLTDGEVRSSGRFPTRDELTQWSGVELASGSRETTTESDTVSVECCAPNDVKVTDGAGCCASFEDVTIGTKSGATPSCC